VLVLATRVSNVSAKVRMGNGKCLSPLGTGDSIRGWGRQFAEVQTAGDDAYVLFTGGGSFYPVRESEGIIESGPAGCGAADRHRPNPA